MHNIVNLQKWPLQDLTSKEGVEMIRECRRELEETGMTNLGGFLHAHAIARIVNEVTPVFADHSFTHQRRHNIYFTKPPEGIPPDHPAWIEFETSNRTICADQIAQSELVKLYEWEPFRAFLAAIMGKEVLFTMSDPLARANVMSYGAAQALNWHFDRSEFTTTLLLQAPQSGGTFQYSKDLRTEQDPNYAGVARLLEGEDDNLRSLEVAPGTLNVFRGKNTAHRVTPVVGETERIIAVFSYFDHPGVAFSDEERLGFYGRTG